MPDSNPRKRGSTVWKIWVPVSIALNIGIIIYVGLDMFAPNLLRPTSNTPPQKEAESPPPDPWVTAVNKAIEASESAQTAATPEEWEAVSNLWREAIKLMQAVPESSENYEAAQQKAKDYQPNLDYARNNAGISE
jgi:hypothetical protein